MGVRSLHSLPSCLLSFRQLHTTHTKYNDIALLAIVLNITFYGKLWEAILTSNNTAMNSFWVLSVEQCVSGWALTTSLSIIVWPKPLLLEPSQWLQYPRKPCGKIYFRFRGKLLLVQSPNRLEDLGPRSSTNDRSLSSMITSKSLARELIR